MSALLVPMARMDPGTPRSAGGVATALIPPMRAVLAVPAYRTDPNPQSGSALFRAGTASFSFWGGRMLLRFFACRPGKGKRNERRGGAQRRPGADRHRVRTLRGPGRATRAADHGGRCTDDQLAGGVLHRAGRPRPAGDPVDSRDTGRSTHFADAPVPDVQGALAGDLSSVSSTLSDLAADSVGLLDVLRLDGAHMVGASLGGWWPRRSPSSTRIGSGR